MLAKLSPWIPPVMEPETAAEGLHSFVVKSVMTAGAGEGGSGLRLRWTGGGTGSLGVCCSAEG